MANSFARGKKDLHGISRVHQVTATIDTYATAGFAVDIPTDLGMSRLHRLDAEVQGGATTLAAIAEWDGSVTAPKVALYDGTFAELAAGAVGPITVLLTAYGR